jgi:hypothetical protein
MYLSLHDSKTFRTTTNIHRYILPLNIQFSYVQHFRHLTSGIKSHAK